MANFVANFVDFVAKIVDFVAKIVDFVAGFRFVPFVPFVAVCGVCGDGHKIRHKSTFGEFRPQNPPHLASLAIVILKMTILCPE